MKLESRSCDRVVTDGKVTVGDPLTATTSDGLSTKRRPEVATEKCPQSFISDQQPRVMLECRPRLRIECFDRDDLRRHRYACSQTSCFWECGRGRVARPAPGEAGSAATNAAVRNSSGAASAPGGHGGVIHATPRSAVSRLRDVLLFLGG